jgi:tetratricopeptide (TPR) repeat protein
MRKTILFLKNAKQSNTRTRVSLVLVLFLTAYIPCAFAEMKDMVKFEIAKKYFHQGSAYFNNMQYLAAAEYFRKAVKEYPDYYTARDNLARAYKLAGFTEEALKEWENLLESFPGNPSVTSKIDNLRFQGIASDKSYGSADYVYYETYAGPLYKRFAFRKPVGIAVDNDKSVYITSFSEGNLVKLDSNGNGVFSIKTSLNSRLYGVDYRDNKIAVSDFKNDRIIILNKRGEKISEFGLTGDGNGRFHGPEGLGYNRRGELYVVDSGNCRVQKFDEAGRFILQFGKRGEYEAELSGPTDLAVLRDRVYVTDTGNKRIACFDDSGNFIGNISIQGLEQPRGISAMGDTLLISDEKAGLFFYKPDDGSTRRFSPAGDSRGALSRLEAVAADRDGYLYCLDYGTESVKLFSPTARQYSNLGVEVTSVDVNSFPTVALYVNIRTRDGNPLYGLGADDFLVTEDGVPITSLYINYLKRLLPSVSIALCVDRSKSVETYHNDIPWVADFILKKMRKNDSIEVLNFNKESWVGNRFDWSRRRTLKALRERQYGEGKNIGTALYHAVSDLLPRLNRRAVVFVTDGGVSDDSFRTYTTSNIIRYARAHFIPIYIVSFREPHEELRIIARETGGAVYRPRQVDGLRSMYAKIKRSEEYRYVLVYPTFKLSNFKGWWSDVKIEVHYKGQRGLEWAGYFVP